MRRLTPLTIALLILALSFSTRDASASVATRAERSANAIASVNQSPKDVGVNPANNSSAALPSQNSVANSPSNTPQSSDANDDRLPFMSDEQRASESNTTSATSAMGMLVRTLGALLLIIGIICGVGWTLKRFGGARFNALTEERTRLEVLSTVTLGDKQTLALVQFGGRKILVGATPQSIRFLASYAETNEAHAPRTVADLLEEDSSLPRELFGDAALQIQTPIENLRLNESGESFDAHLSAAFSRRQARLTGELG